MKRRMNISLADRISLISSVSRGIKTRPSRDILKRALVNLDQAIDSSLIQSEDLVTLMEELRGNLDTKRWKDLLTKTKTFLADSLAGLEDYRALTRFLKTFPGVFSEGEVQVLAKSFPPFAERFVWELTTADPDDLRTYAEEIGSIADDLDVNVFDIVSDLEESAGEAEELAEREERKERDNIPPEDFVHSDPMEKLKKATYEVTDREIESMFSSLR